MVVVHGVGKQVSGPELLASELVPALRSGVTLAGGPGLTGEEVAVAFYGDLFRRPGTRAGTPDYGASDVQPGLETDLLISWWEAAAQHERAVPGPGDSTRGRTPRVIQRALDALSHSRFFAGLGERAMVAALKQVRIYLTEDRVRREARQRVADCVDEDTQVIVAHSLGSVVAYEALSANPDWPVGAFVTLGSPLGIRNVIFERLCPPPRDGRGHWPGGVTSWTNIADAGDVVALVKRLATRFGDRVHDVPVHNGAKAHDCRPYLTAKETGRAILDGLGR
ncbi:hypothetical protein AOZ06_24825 [Kibdelosporangium phytohabitans]|uniref:Mucin n=1 Tax=Kibdelosporangium phytohabitans TaxID=860235 RepID=A0A0N7F5S4_9PSEU|nr:hypothetical protein AOZ06_24825 [Kibdelosporangium phytohabitans]